MNLLNRLTIKNLKLNKKRTIVTIIGIMLSVALITAVASVYTSGIKSLAKYEAKQMGNFHAAYFDVDSEDLLVIGNNKAIKDFYLVRNIGYAKIDSKNEYKPYAYIKAFNKKALEELAINLVEGNMPTNDHEILVPRHLKTNGRLTINVGEKIKLNVGDRSIDGEILNQSNPYQEGEKLVNIKQYEYTVVGIMERPASNVEDYSSPGYTFITYDEAVVDGKYDIYTLYNKNGVKHFYEVTGNILGIDGKEFDRCYGKENKSVASEEDYDKCMALTENVKYGFTPNQYLVELETNPLGSGMVTGLDVIAIVICVIIVFTSVFCIKNSFDISITEKIRQYGMLRSIGSTQKQIKKNVFFEATILGMFGIPLGLLLGFLASFILMIISNLFVKDILGISLAFEFSWLATIVAIVLGIITVYLSALSSARKASKVSPIDSIRNSANIKINPKKIKSPKFIKKIFGIGGEISYKNLKRNKKKYRTTVISIIVSVFIFVALSSFMDLVFRSVKEDFKTTEYNLSVYLFDAKHEYNIVNNYINELVTDDTVEKYGVSKSSSILIENPKLTKEAKENISREVYDVNMILLDNATYKEYVKSLGLKYENVKDKAILVDNVRDYTYDDELKKTKEIVYKVFTYNENDVIEGIVDNKKVTLEIGHVASTRPFGYETQTKNYYLFMDDASFDYNIESYIIDIKTKNADKLQDLAEKLFKDYEVEIQNVDQNYKMVNNLYTLIAIFLYGFIIVISLIGITNIFNTITTNMELRKREFAMLKSVGMTKKEFNRMIRLESLFMGFKSLFFGIIIGVALSYIVYNAIDQDILTYHLPIKGIIISIVVVFMLISLIMGYSIKKINKQNTIETIRNENI